MLPDPSEIPYLGDDPKSYVRTRIDGGNTVYARDTAEYVRGTGYPLYLRISHTQVGKGSNLRDRHLLRLEAPCLNADGENGLFDSIYCVADFHRNTAAYVLQVKLWEQFSGALIGGNAKVGATAAFDPDAFFKRWVNGEA